MKSEHQKDPRGFHKGRSSKFHEGSWVWQTPEEGQRTYWLKRCENINKDEDSSLKTLKDKKLWTAAFSETQDCASKASSYTCNFSCFLNRKFIAKIRFETLKEIWWHNLIWPKGVSNNIYWINCNKYQKGILRKLIFHSWQIYH